jgi:hypothetical protein
MLRRGDPRITAGHFYQRHVNPQPKQESIMKMSVEDTTIKDKADFQERKVVDVVIDGRQRIALTYAETYELARDLLAWLHHNKQVEGYKIVTKAGSRLNATLTKDW